MKKFRAAFMSFAFITIAVTMLMSVNILAGTFDEYVDYAQPDGTYTYAFPRVLVTMDETWYQNTRVVMGENGSTVSFYHKASCDAYTAEGQDGGRLFTIGASVNADFMSLPNTAYLGFDEEESMNYYVQLPTDYQAYTGDEAIRKEYDALWSGVQGVIDGILVKGTEKYKKNQKSADSTPAPSEDGSPRLYEYAVSGDKTSATITKYNGTSDDIQIPSKIDNYEVTAIGDLAFQYRKMKSLSVPDSVRSIGKRAFEYCEISEQFQLPENVAISEDAFSYAELPSVVIIPSGAVVKDCAFSYCEDMETLLIGPGSVIKSRAFGYCYDLEQIVAADGVQIEKDAFEYCDDLEKVVLCGNVKAGAEAFSYCEEYDTVMMKAEDFDSWLSANSAQGRGAGTSGDDTSSTGTGSPGNDTSPKGTDSSGNDTSSTGTDSSRKDLTITGSPASKDGVTVTLDTASAQLSPRKTGFDYQFSGTIENNTDEGIMQVTYTFALTDVNGEDYRSFAIVYDGEDKAIPPHTKIPFSHDGIKWGKQSVPASVKIGLSSVKTEAELPPAHIPKKGEYLYQTFGDEKLAKIKEEAPVELSFHVDQGGYGRTATFTEGAKLDRAVELLCDIKIGDESGEFVTDNYNWIGLTWKDGSRTGISINLNKLEYSIHSSLHTYELENLDEFWTYCAGYLKEDQ